MSTEIYKWKGKNSFEILELSHRENLIEVESLITGISKEQKYKIIYSLVLSASWEIEEVRLFSSLSASSPLHLRNCSGHWYDATNRELSSLRGCRDIDISVTPFTNTLPINRMSGKLDEPKTFDVVFINVFVPGTERAIQEYCEVNKGIYFYRSHSSGFSSYIYVDQKGVVTEYPGLFYREGTGEESAQE